jgi:hypothetical protein
VTVTATPRLLPFSTSGGALLFHLSSKLYERTSVVITTHLSFSELGSIFGDTKLTTELLDRLTNHCYILATGNGSYRLTLPYSLCLWSPRRSSPVDQILAWRFADLTEVAGDDPSRDLCLVEGPARMAARRHRPDLRESRVERRGHRRSVCARKE